MKLNFFLTMGVVCLVASVSFAAGPKKHRKIQKPPIKLGTTGGNVSDFRDTDTAPFCLDGSLGALVQKGSKQYILSDAGVLARHFDDGKKGDPIIQPGLQHTKGGKCNADSPKNNTVADLSKFVKVKFNKNNKAHGGLAEVRPGMVDPQGKIIGIGIPGGHTVKPAVGQRVKKSGPGTGVKLGTVIARNFSNPVGFGWPPGSAPFANFVKQLIVESNSNKPLVVSGDEGSVFFEDKKNCPGWVGLTVGATPDGQIVLVTPINVVLNELKNGKPKGPFKPVGCDSAVAAVEEPESLEMQQAMLDAEAIQDQVENEVMLLPGVIGMGIGVAKDNPEEVVFKILVEDDTEAIRENIPERLGKVRSEIVVTGRFSAF